MKEQRKNLDNNKNISIIKFFFNLIKVTTPKGLKKIFLHGNNFHGNRMKDDKVDISSLPSEPLPRNTVHGYGYTANLSRLIFFSQYCLLDCDKLSVGVGFNTVPCLYSISLIMKQINTLFLVTDGVRLN